MKFLRNMVLVLSVLAFCALGLAACEKEGPAERAGKKLDHTLDSAKDAVHEATK